MKTKGVRLAVVFLFFVFLSGGGFLFPESGIYDRLGIWPESGYHGAIPEEFQDLFTGAVTLKFLDISLPGPNGFDVNLYRVYNSKILRDRLPGSLWGIQQEPYSYVGLGRVAQDDIHHVGGQQRISGRAAEMQGGNIP